MRPFKIIDFVNVLLSWVSCEEEERRLNVCDWDVFYLFCIYDECYFFCQFKCFCFFSHFIFGEIVFFFQCSFIELRQYLLTATKFRLHFEEKI